MAKHTPGPWVALGEYVYADPGVMPVAEVHTYPRAENARLIAASPDLLKVAKAVVALEILRPDGPVNQDLLAAIAKGEGEGES